MSTPLTYTHLRFDVIAQAPLRLGGHQAGERLRDALAAIMLRSACADNPRRQKPTPEHAAACPVCWLLAHENEPGEVRRAYSLVAPLPAPDILEPGRRFSFVVTLFGSGARYLPYFILAVPDMGRLGVGPGRGQFDLEAIWAVEPFSGAAQAVLKPGEQVVHVPDVCSAWAQAAAQAGLLEPSETLQVEFLSPTRLIEGEALVKAPDFSVFYRRLLERIDDLARQYGGSIARRPREEMEERYRLADQVRLVESAVEWIDLWGPSGRTGRRTPMGGFVGRAVYRARQWGPLLADIVFGQGVQAGKLAVKGNGVYQVEMPGGSGYWQAVFAPQANERF